MVTPNPETDAARRVQLRAAQRHDDFEDVKLPELPEIPGMVGDNECRYLYWLTASTWSGAGDVVELGSWLGRSAAHLAAGMRDSGKNGSLWCFDRWRYDKHEHPHQDKPADVFHRMKNGADLRPIFRKHVAGIHPVFAVKTPIEKMRWHGAPVEILFLDAPKQTKVLRHVLGQFAPALIPGTSFVASQDFGYPFAWCQSLVFARLADCLELVHTVGWTAGFRVVKPLPTGDELQARLDLRSLGTDESIRLFEEILARIPDEKFRARLRPAICFHLYRNGETELACRMLKETPISDYNRKRWQAWMHAERWDAWSELFLAIGLTPPPRPERAEKKESHGKRSLLRGWLDRVGGRSGSRANKT